MFYVMLLECKQLNSPSFSRAKVPAWVRMVRKREFPEKGCPNLKLGCRMKVGAWAPGLRRAAPQGARNFSPLWLRI